jgi:hypothetical protein
MAAFAGAVRDPKLGGSDHGSSFTSFINSIRWVSGIMVERLPLTGFD